MKKKITAISPTLFYLLSFTWGAPVTLFGLLMAGVLLIMGKKPQKWGYCYYFEAGERWGGTELGIFFVKDKVDSRHIKDHEHGHALQNCLWGPLMIPVISLPSFLRYWYRRIIVKLRPKTKLPPYDAIWFEGQATDWGSTFTRRLEEQTAKDKR